MTDQPTQDDGTAAADATDATDEESLRQKARERNEAMPAESALGHRDPQGGGEGEPEDFKGDGN
jgi:hypothetical protein